MFYCESCRIKNEWPEAYNFSHGKCECCGAVDRCYDRPSSTLPPARRASPAAAVPEGALPPLPKDWKKRMQEADAPNSAHYQTVYMEAEIAEWRARAAVEADRAQQGEPVFPELSENEIRALLTKHYPGWRNLGGYLTFYRALRDLAATRAAAPADVPKWGRVDTVGDMVRNLLTLDQGAPIFTAFHLSISGERRCKVNGVTISRERVIDGTWIDSNRKDAPYCHVIWAKPDERALPVPDTGIPTAGEVPFSEATEYALFEFIRHGDQAHEDWLHAALTAFRLGQPKPSYVAGISTGAAKLNREAPKLAKILFGMCEGPGEDRDKNIYADGYQAGDGDIYVYRAAEVLIEQAAEIEMLVQTMDLLGNQLASRRAPVSTTPTSGEVEGAEFLAEVFNRLTQEQKLSVPQEVAGRIGAFMVRNGYRIVFGRWYLQAAPSQPSEAKAGEIQ